MKPLKKNIKKGFLLLGSVLIIACSNDDSNNSPTTPEVIDPIDETPATALDLTQFSANDGVMMQAFYWDVEPIGGWYDEVNTKIEDWAASGINRIWLPAPGKGQSGMYSMGYDPSDYFDLGEFDQHGTVETRFGSRAELENLIDKAHNNNIEVIADIVLGHNSGGGEEYNSYRDKQTYTLFDETHGNASGLFNRTFEDYHPNSYHEHDEQALFFEEQDVCHHQDNVQNWFWKNDNSVAKFYKNTIGFDGWRFDYVKSFGPWVVKAWNDEVGGFSVGENFDGNSSVLEEWVEASESAAFDFACFYRLEEALDRHKDLTILEGGMLRKTYPDKAVTFTANHDTEKDSNEDNYIMSSNKMKAYAYILTHDGYPTIFYNDYEGSNKEELKKLIQIHNSIATGDVEVLELNKFEYIMKRNGSGDNPGLILYISLTNGIKARTIQSNWNDKTLIDYSGNIVSSVKTNEDGTVTIKAPGNGYAIWSIAAE